MKLERHGLPSHFLSNYFEQWMLDNWVIAFGTAGVSRRWALVALVLGNPAWKGSPNCIRRCQALC